jgi:hypothetical protein
LDPLQPASFKLDGKRLQERGADRERFQIGRRNAVKGLS